MRALKDFEQYRTAALVGVAVLLGLTLGIRSIVEFRTSSIASLREKYETKVLEFEKYSKLMANRDRYVRSQAELDSAVKNIVSTQFISAKTTALAEVRFQDMLDTIAKKNDLTIISRKVLKAVEIGELKEMRVAITCRAEIGLINNFLYELSVQNTAIFVDSLEIKRLGDKDERYYNFNAVFKAYSL